jgi:hypothetical protein
VKIEIPLLPVEFFKKYFSKHKIPLIILSDFCGKEKASLEGDDLTSEKLLACMQKTAESNKKLVEACKKKGCDACTSGKGKCGGDKGCGSDSSKSEKPQN